MSREHFKGGCGIAICAMTDPHDHFRCDECGAQDYTGSSCLTCVTLRQAKVVGTAMEWAFDAVAGKKA